MRGTPSKQSEVWDVMRVSFRAHHLLNDVPMTCDVGPPQYKEKGKTHKHTKNPGPTWCWHVEMALKFPESLKSSTCFTHHVPSGPGFCYPTMLKRIETLTLDLEEIGIVRSFFKYIETLGCCFWMRAFVFRNPKPQNPSKPYVMFVETLLIFYTCWQVSFIGSRKCCGSLVAR